MIVRPKPNLLGILFSLKGSIAKRIALRSLLVRAMRLAIEDRKSTPLNSTP